MGLCYSWGERSDPWTLLACHPHGGARGVWATEINTVPGIARRDLLNLEVQVWACATAGGNAAIRGRCWRATRTAGAAEGGQQNLVPFLELRAVIC